MRRNALQRRIESAPVYLMVLDVIHPDRPVFLGGTSVRIHGSVHDLYVGEYLVEQSTYPIHSMVGARIGKMDALCRITRLGDSLSPHMPGAAPANTAPTIHPLQVCCRP
jgi:hypothetical protein